MSLSSTLATVLIGVPSVGIAAATLWFSRRAHRQQMDVAAARESSAGVTAEAGAYTRARAIDESAIADLRRQVDDLHAEVRRLGDDLAASRERAQQAQAVTDELRTTIAMLRAEGTGHY